MKIPILPLVIAATLLTVVVYLFNSTASDKKTFGPAQLQRVVDFDGTETEVAIAPDGTRLVAIASGDVWLLNSSDGSRQQLTHTPEAESFPAWAPDGRLTFTRGPDTFAASGADLTSHKVFKENAISLSWSGTGRVAFVRDRALWLTDAAGMHDQQFFAADADPDVTVRNPRFSPDSIQLAFIKSALDLRGEVWLADVTTGETPRALVADRLAENPFDVGWLENGTQLVYLTNRSGAFALWIVDLVENTLVPLTVTLDGIPFQRIGIAVGKDRIIVPRHFVDSDITISDGTVVAGSGDLEFEPAVSPDGKVVAYTVEKDKKFEIWTAGIGGENPAFRTLGREPRFSPSGFHIVYTHTDVEGRVDLRKIDLRDGSSEGITDAEEIDFQPDWSPDGRTIAFASGRGGGVGLWTMPAVGGKRLRLNDAGYNPRFLDDGQSLLFWNQRSLWTVRKDGENPRVVRENVPEPVPAIWLKGAAKYHKDPEINGGKEIWPVFDLLPDGRAVIAPIKIKETSLWSVGLTYVAK